MSVVSGPHKKREAQTLVFFILAFGTIILLCGLAIDSGLLFLAKAKMSRAVDGASLAAVGNFNRVPNNPGANRDAVAVIMRNFAVANFTDLGQGPAGGVATSSTSTQTPYTLPTGVAASIYTYNFNDGRQDANGQYKQFVKVVLTTGAGGQITTATCEARCPVKTYFIGFAGDYFRDLKVSSSAIATRNPRLIMVVIDRSASMLDPGGGAYGLPTAVTEFLNFFDTTSDYIGIVSFSSNARLEMALTTNFLYAGTNILVNSYQTETNSDGSTEGVPGVDSDANPPTGTGVRRMKFGGQTAADDGIRMGMEQLMANSGFNDPNVVKYMVIFTDGQWNQVRTMVAAPGYTNIVVGPPLPAPFGQPATNEIVSTSATWGTNMANNWGILPVPTLSPLPGMTNAVVKDNTHYVYSELAPDHTNDFWQSSDGLFEPLGTPATKVGQPALISTDTYLATDTNNLPVYTHNIDVWLPPGSVSYYYSSTNVHNPVATVSDYTKPDQHISVYLNNGDSNVLVVPGYIADGELFDGLDMGIPDDWDYFGSDDQYDRYRVNNFDESYMWPDDPIATSTAQTAMNSMMRQLMFRNYANLLTGFYVFRSDDPLSTTPEPLTGAMRPINGLGPWYPSAGFYWPFDYVGNDSWATYCLLYPYLPDPDPNYSEGFDGGSRHVAWSINMQSTNAAPNWTGEWFYKGNSATLSDTTAASTLMSGSADWQVGAPQWMLNSFNGSTENIMTNEPAHNPNLAVGVWRPTSLNGTLLATTTVDPITGIAPVPASVTPSGSITGGYVTDGQGHFYVNSMGYSGRPTHYFDFSNSSWEPIPSGHIFADPSSGRAATMTNLCYWKAKEYAWHARAMGVTIFTVGYGTQVQPAQQVILAQIANSTNTTAGNPQNPYVDGIGTSIIYNPNQPIGRQFYASSTNDIINDFYSVGQAINAALTQ